MNNHTASDFTVSPGERVEETKKVIQDRLREGLAGYIGMTPDVEKVIKGFAAYETISVVLVNVTECSSCQALINYNGLPPEKCQKCRQ